MGNTLFLIAGTIATTAREVVRARRRAGERIGLVKIKQYRPFPAEEIRRACRASSRIAVLDRNYAAGSGGIFWQDTRAAFQGHRDDLLIQNYLTGLCGGDVTAALVPAGSQAHAEVVVRESAVLCGRAWFDEVFRQLDPAIVIDWLADDGDSLQSGQRVCGLSGSARPLLSGERTALNFLMRMSGIATVTRRVGS